MTQVDIYMLDWNSRRPFDFSIPGEASDQPSLREQCVEAFETGRYEYTASVQVSDTLSHDRACEAAYKAQGNNDYGTKVRTDRQTMSESDAVIVEGMAYVCARFGFTRVPELDARLPQRIEQSWNRWTDDEPSRDESATAAQLAADVEQLSKAVALVLALQDKPAANVPGHLVKLDPMAEAQLRAALDNIDTAAHVSNCGDWHPNNYEDCPLPVCAYHGKIEDR